MSLTSGLSCSTQVRSPLIFPVGPWTTVWATVNPIGSLTRRFFCRDVSYCSTGGRRASCSTTSGMRFGCWIPGGKSSIRSSSVSFYQTRATAETISAAGTMTGHPVPGDRTCRRHWLRSLTESDRLSRARESRQGGRNRSASVVLFRNDSLSEKASARGEVLRSGQRALAGNWLISD